MYHYIDNNYTQINLKIYIELIINNNFTMSKNI